MVNYNIVNKVYMQGKKKNVIFRILLSVMSIILILLGIVQIIVGQISITLVFQSILLPLVLASYARQRFIGGTYKSMALELTLEQHKLTLLYSSIDRDDGGGIRKETIVINSEDIEDIKYSEDIKSVKIVAKSQLTVEYRDHTKDNFYLDYRKENKTDEYIIYLPFEQKEKILKDIQTYLEGKIVLC